MKTFIEHNAIIGGDSNRALLLAIAAATLVGGAPTTVAQQLMLEEVVVTAQKRTESLQDVPISVAAVSGEKISNIGITGLSVRF